MFQLNANLDK